MTRQVAPLQGVGAPMFNNFGLMTPEMLQQQKQQQWDAQLQNAGNNPNGFAGNGELIGLGLGKAIGNAVDSHYGRVDPQMQSAQQNDAVLHQIFQEAGGDPVQALQIAAQKGIPGAQQQWAQVQQQQATLQKTQGDITNQTTDNARQQAAEERAAATAKENTQKDTWETVKETPAYFVQKNGLGQIKVERKETAAGEAAAANPVAPEDKDAYATEIAKYNQPFPTAGSRSLKATGMSLPELIRRVKDINPKATGQGYAAAQYFVGKGDGASTLQAHEAASHHLAQYLEAVDAYHGTGSLVPLNKLAVSLGLNTGDSAPAILNTIAGVLGPEITKGLIKSGGGVNERKDKEKQLIAYLADAQKVGNARTYMGLLYGQRQALQQRYLSSLPGTTKEDFDAQFPIPAELQSLGQPKATTGAYSDADKEKRYQAWKAAHPNG
jgi:hypothetical protein